MRKKEEYTFEDLVEEVALLRAENKLLEIELRKATATAKAVKIVTKELDLKSKALTVIALKLAAEYIARGGLCGIEAIQTRRQETLKWSI